MSATVDLVGPGVAPAAARAASGYTSAQREDATED